MKEKRCETEMKGQQPQYGCGEYEYQGSRKNIDGDPTHIDMCTYTHTQNDKVETKQCGEMENE